MSNLLQKSWESHRNRLTAFAGLILSVGLAGCASSNDGLEAPSYATMWDNDSYRVICTGVDNRDVYVRYNAMDTFYNEDGTTKTRDEFCRENAAGARSR
ncbi:MAG: hypothetical protein CMQ46_06355 [Gammaproteobacteria bacterium]|nr:hypothetical protein [Gammaproteobacteria bacterium]MBJ54865.1 hypothetical protein [Gammaproteobacteria bacterium]HBN15846.1 hypothetical protein [Pseudohongiella sp.]|tara:strand:+ start:288 stop:584 length:297 start_codon:yes stop_codon:yes gene_type:complete